MRHARFNRLNFSLLLFLILFLVIAGCGSTGSGDGDSELPPDEYEAEPFKTTKILEEGSLATLAKIDDDGTLHFDGIPAELKAVVIKDVIVSGPGVSTDGFIRMVTEVQSDSQGLVLKTVPVPIQLAFRKLHVKFTRKIENIADLGIAPAPKVKKGKKVLGKGKWMELPIDFFAFNGDDDPLTLDDQVHVTGKLSGGIEYFFGFDIDWEEVFDVPDKVADCAKNLFSRIFFFKTTRKPLSSNELNDILNFRNMATA